MRADCRAIARSYVRGADQGRERQDLRFWYLRTARQIRTRRPQPQDGGRSADRAAPRADLPAEPSDARTHRRCRLIPQRMAASDKAEGAFRTIGELARELGLPQHILRYWETRFPQLRPLQRAGNRRYYRPSDAALVRRIDT